MSNPFLGEIKIVSFNFAPKGWALCNGQTLPINQNQALFSLLNTMYGGDGITTFALPNLQGRWVVGQGSGPGLSSRTMGAAGGQIGSTLTANEMPAHSHTLIGVQGSLVPNRDPSPAGRYWSNEPRAVPGPQKPPYRNTQPDTNLALAALADTGGGQGHENRPPYLVLNHIIALQGIFPSQD